MFKFFDDLTNGIENVKEKLIFLQNHSKVLL